MNKEYLNVVITDPDEGMHLLFKSVFQEIRMEIKVRSWYNIEELAGYMKKKPGITPDVLFIKYSICAKSGTEWISKIKSDPVLSPAIIIVYSSGMSAAEEQEVFLHGANVIMQISDNYKDIKKSLTEIMVINWQYYTSGLNKNNFIMKV